MCEDLSVLDFHLQLDEIEQIEALFGT